MNKKISIAIIMIGLLVAGWTFLYFEPQKEDIPRKAPELIKVDKKFYDQLTNKVISLGKQNEELKKNNSCTGEYENSFWLKDEKSGRVVIVNNCDGASIYVLAQDGNMIEVYRDLDEHNPVFFRGRETFSPDGKYVTIRFGRPQTDAGAELLLNIDEDKEAHEYTTVGGWGAGSWMWSQDSSYLVATKSEMDIFGTMGISIRKTSDIKNSIDIFPGIEGEEYRVVDSRTLQLTPESIFFEAHIYLGAPFTSELFRIDSYEYDISSGSLNKL
jgi:hypothetical protein